MIKVICVAYERPIPMRGLIDSFLLQTNPDWELDIIYDGPIPEDIWAVLNLYNDARLWFDYTEVRTENYGHLNRKAKLEEAESSDTDFILMTNDDNYYVPVFIDYFLKEITSDVGFVYCDSVHSHFEYNLHKTKVKVDHIDIGSFIVRADMAKMAGFHNITFNADGEYAEACLAMCHQHGLREVYIPKPLFIHN